VAVEGEGAVAAVSRFFHLARGRQLEDIPVRRIVYGEWRSDQDRQHPSVGEGVVVCRMAPQRVEVHAHGGRAAVANIVASLVSVGCQEIAWQDWLQAVESNAVAAEARVALAEARTERAAAILLDQYRGALARAVEEISQDLHAGRMQNASQQLDQLLDRAPLGLHLTRPWRIVLAGRPNVGKSSLINALVGYQRAIVHDQPGVTRDVVTAATALDGWPVELADTAGVRESDDPLEAAGVARTRDVLQTADVVALVFDATQDWTADDAALLAAKPGALVVHNKCDLPSIAASGRPAGIHVSAVTGLGLEELKHAMTARMTPDPPWPGAAVPFTVRQVGLLREAQRHLAAQEHAAAQDCLQRLLAPGKL
jgi:tRNA modification GTPase